MRFLSVLILGSTTAAFAQGPRIELSHSTESLRGVSAVSHDIAWASGTHGTYLRTIDAGLTWTPAQVPDATTLDFRAVVAFSADEAFLMSAGPGDESRIYHTTDAGQHWQLQFTNTNPKGFFDSMAFWDPKHGIVLGDPIPDERGQLHFEILMTDDGQTWHQLPASQLPPAIQGEGAFAASNSCIAILPPTQNTWGQPPSAVQPSEARQGSAGAPAPRPAATEDRASAPEPNPLALVLENELPSRANIWFATGGRVARVFHSPDGGHTWQVFDTPILHGPDSAGIFSIAFRDPLHGVIAGGDYKHPRDDGPNLAFTTDGGRTWTLSDIKPQAYFSAVAYDAKVQAESACEEAAQSKEQAEGKKLRAKPTPPQRLFIIGQDFIFDFRPPLNPHRIGGQKKPGYAFNAVSPLPTGGALVVGPKGTIAFIP